MSVRLAVATVIAHDGGLDQARPIAVAADGQHEHGVTRVLARESWDLDTAHVRRGDILSRVSRNDIPDERAQLGLRHSCTSTWSTIPMIAASTGAPFRPRASPAARPSMTMSTRS
jgi:hypothetical protein